MSKTFQNSLQLIFTKFYDAFWENWFLKSLPIQHGSLRQYWNKKLETFRG